jgi:hypothetical protein
MLAGDQHLVYFYCHGFTERMAADIQISDDLLGQFRAWFDSLPEERRKALKPPPDKEMFDVSDSKLELTRGVVKLTRMEDALLDQGARFRNGPLVFLNMCESAQVLPSLSGGFIPFFIEFGARGVIGTECPMTSTFANPFAQKFLQRFLRGNDPAGRILLDLRREYLYLGSDREGRPLGNPLGLAYTLYCDAEVQLKRSATMSVPAVVENLERSQKMDEQYLQELVADNMDNEEYTLDQVFDELGRREVALEKGMTDQAGDPEVYPDPPADETIMGIGDTFAEFGKRLWANYEPQLYALLCDEKHPEHDKFLEALKDGAGALAVALVPTLAGLPGMLPAFVVVAATIVGKQVAKEGLKTVCQMWKESMDNREEEEEEKED